MPGVVVLTSGRDFASRVLIGLSLRQVVPEATFVAPLPSTAAPVGAARWKRILQPRSLAAAAARGLLNRVRNSGPGGWSAEWAEFSRRTEVMGSFNGSDMESAIRELAPEYLVLAGAGIVRKGVLELPSRGTINVHPALPPWIRGVGVVGRS